MDTHTDQCTPPPPVFTVMFGTSHANTGALGGGATRFNVVFVRRDNRVSCTCVLDGGDGVDAGYTVE